MSAKPSIWWTGRPLSHDDHRLLSAVLGAHARSVERENASSCAFLHAGFGSGKFHCGVAAAILATGGVHAPLQHTCAVLEMEIEPMEAYIVDTVANGGRVPGWGNSFHKNMPDPVWEEVEQLLRNQGRPVFGKIEAGTNCLRRLGKKVFPNPSAYTAAAALALGIPAHMASYLFIAGRLDGWAHLWWCKAEPINQ